MNMVEYCCHRDDHLLINAYYAVRSAISATAGLLVGSSELSQLNDPP